jgi:hypothetical protein
MSRRMLNPFRSTHSHHWLFEQIPEGGCMFVFNATNSWRANAHQFGFHAFVCDPYRKDKPVLRDYYVLRKEPRRRRTNPIKA